MARRAAAALLLAATLMGVRAESYDELDEFADHPDSLVDSATEMDMMKGMGIVQVLYCVSWSYKGNFLRVKQLLEHKYPSVIVEGGNFPPPEEKLALAKVLNSAISMSMMMLFVGEFLFVKIMGLPIPQDILDYVNENRWMIFGCLFLANGLVGNLMATGAFEVSYNGKLVYSKLEKGRMPSVQELMGGLVAAGIENNSLPGK